MKTPQLSRVDELYWQLADELRKLAQEACRDEDRSRVHWLVAEERRMADMPRKMKLRFGNLG